LLGFGSGGAAGSPVEEYISDSFKATEWLTVKPVFWLLA